MNSTTHQGHPGTHQLRGINAVAVAATLHCLTGCAIGEIAGLVIGTSVGMSSGSTVVLSVALAFVFGFALSSLPLLKAGLALGAALRVVVAADALSIATMEVVDNAVMVAIPGAMNAGLVNVAFWVSLALALAAAFAAAYPVNRYLLRRGRGHALTHHYHRGPGAAVGARRLIPDIATSTLVAALVAFLLGGLLVSVAASLAAVETGGDSGGHAAQGMNRAPAAVPKQF